VLNNLYGAFMDTQVLPVAATYTVMVDPSSTSTGSTTLTLYNVPADFTGTITPGGSPVTATITTPGQDARLTFNGTAGQRVSLKLSGGLLSDAFIYNPDGSTLASTAVNGSFGAFIDTQTLPTSGTYTIHVNPKGTSTVPTPPTGNITLTLYDVPADATGTITPGGSAVTKTTTVPGQDVRLTFSGTAGQRVSVRRTGLNSDLTLLNPDGSTLATTSLDFIDTQTLPTTGTYTIWVNPRGTSTVPTPQTGNVTLTLYDVVDITGGTLIINDPAVNVTITTPGQNALFTFAGTSGQQVTGRLSSNGISCVNLRLLRPDGTQQTSGFTCGATLNLSTQTLATTGTYTVVVDPSGYATGTTNVRVTSP
jgi:hypothetical protein